MPEEGICLFQTLSDLIRDGTDVWLLIALDMQVQNLGLMFTVSEYFNYDITYVKQGLKYIFLRLWKKGCNTEPNHKTLLQAKEMAVSGLNRAIGRTLVTSVF